MKRLLECIDRGLDNFGAGVQQVVYFRLKQSLNMEREDVVKNPEKFEAFLDAMFGVGAERVKRSIMKEIDATFELDSANSMSDAIHKARNIVYRNCEPIILQIQIGERSEV
jgi:hypothetical protein